jgi:hypothetical protein
MPVRSAQATLTAVPAGSCSTGPRKDPRFGDSHMTEAERANSLQGARSELGQLRQRFDELEKRTSLISPSFLRRAFAVYGHNFVAGLIIAVPFMILFFAIFIAAGLLFRPH